MSKKLFTLTVLGGLMLANSAFADKLTVISYGGASKAAQVTAFYKPYEEKTKTQVIAGEWNGEISKLIAMNDTKTVTWDVLDTEDTDRARGCEEGLFEKLDYERLGTPGDWIEGTKSDDGCGVGIFVWSNVLAYSADKLKVAPTGWADFWDVKKFPGKRSLRKSARGSLEFALMADGVPPAEVYKLLSTKEGVDRAFKKLDEIKPYIQWWEAGAQPPQYLVAGDVVMASSYNGRIHAAQQSGSNLKIVWNQNLYQFDEWAIPRGTKNLDKAYDFIKFAMQPEQQKLYTEQMAYGPSNTKAAEMLDKSLADDLPTAAENQKNALRVNVEFWLENAETLEQKFNAWASKS